jgi:hypothetical protein
LEATPAEDRRMLRTIPFLLRGIGDKRAIPALIRAIPRCYGNDGSDMGYRCEDPELLAFLQLHDNSDRDDRDGYNYGRPLNEVFRTLQRWTGVKHDWNQLAFVSAHEGTERQEQIGQKLFQENALRWARWWEEHWSEHVDDADYSKVNLPAFESQEPIVIRLDRTKPLKRANGRSGLIAQPVYNAQSERTFCDLDTGRWSGLPQNYRGRSREELSKLLPAIMVWAKANGFDVMGTEVEHQGRSFYALEAIDLEAWEIPMSYWRSREAHPPQSMIDAGRPVKRLLAYFDAEQNAYDPSQLAVFFYITNEGTPGLLYLGVEVKDTNVIIGTPSTPNEELNPIGFWKGRRFGLAILAESQ